MAPVLDAQEHLPTVPLSGMYNKSGGKLRLTLKPEQDQLWIGTKEWPEKLPMGSIKKRGQRTHRRTGRLTHDGISVGSHSSYWVYWLPTQCVDAIEDIVLGKWQYFCKRFHPWPRRPTQREGHWQESLQHPWSAELWNFVSNEQKNLDSLKGDMLIEARGNVLSPLASFSLKNHRSFSCNWLHTILKVNRVKINKSSFRKQKN